MCYFKNEPIGEMCAKCQSCDNYLSLCIPMLVDNGVVLAECDDLIFCEYCFMYSECEVLWKGGV